MIVDSLQLLLHFSLCCGIDPTTVRFEQEKMRPHLIKCLETKTCSMFPSNPIRKRAKYVEKCESISIYCSCRLPNDGKPMVHAVLSMLKLVSQCMLTMQSFRYAFRVEL